jgi:hypothetical protein
MRTWIVCAVWLGIFGCAPDKGNASPSGDVDGDDGGADTGEPLGEPIDVPGDAFCEPLAEGACMLPWPSDRWLVSGDTVTGVSLAYEPDAAPVNGSGTPLDVSTFGRDDGFSPSSQLLTIFSEPADLSGVAFHDSIDDSLADDHPTVLIDLETGERLAHWVENDARATEPGETILFVRPITRLEPNHRYGVAIRNLSGMSGDTLEASPAFVALRDNRPTDRDDIESRREEQEGLFAALEGVGVARAELQQAWWFHTASEESTRGTLLSMRADALDRIGESGLGCTVNSLEDVGTIGRLMHGTVTVPWYLDGPSPPASIVRDADGSPVYQGTEEIEFAAYVPRTIIESEDEGTVMVWGHGLFGSGAPLVEATEIMLLAETTGRVMVATDWHGMSTKDLEFLVGALWDVSDFYMVGENLQQGMVIQNTLTRTIMHGCAGEEGFLNDAGTSAVSSESGEFVGISQGSVLGGGFLTQSPDIDRGALIVGGANFSFMIERSIHFNTYETFLMPSYGSRLVTAQLMALSQHVWDNVETAAWIGAAKEGLADAGPKRFLYLVAQNDAQVPNLSSDITVRMTDMPVLEDSSYIPWGSEVISGSTTDSAFVSFDMGDRDPPRGNESPDVDDGGHNSAGLTQEALDMIIHFLDTGVIESTCGGPCVF